MKVHFDAKAKIRFFAPAEGGLVTRPVTGYRAKITHSGNNKTWSTLFTFDKEADVAWLSFLSPHGAREGLSADVTFTIWDGRRRVGEGSILHVLAPESAIMEMNR